TPTTSHWASSSDILFGFTIYIGISAFILNLAIAVVLTLVLRAFRVPEGADDTLPHEFTADPVSREDSSPLRPPEALQQLSPLHQAAPCSRRGHTNPQYR
ncbi:MAG: sodium:solute symporter, partial [Actinomycetia bacterium]|nr:sodium:solute symporter [Actinomycetes bacterium]